MYRRSRQLFLRALGLIYAIAFLSWDAQVEGLVGKNGILPAADLLQRVQSSLGASAAHLQLPTLLWLDASDRALHLIARGGCACALLVILGLAPLPLLFACFVLYLSLVTTGSVFMNFQWDSLLLEAGLLAILYAPPVLRLGRAAEPPRATRLLLVYLLFRLMFLSGIVKLTWGDHTWRDLSALEYHFYTQPIPSLLSWWAQQAGKSAHAVMTAITFGIEIVLPFFFFAPRALRLVACAAQIALQLGILATGNYGFFNWLALALCIPLLDDAALDSITPRFLRRPPPDDMQRPNRIAAVILATCALALFVFGFSVYESMETPAVDRSGNVPLPVHGEQLLGGHAVLAVGYDDARRVINFRNSWGTGWGDGGYGTIPYAYITNPSLAGDMWMMATAGGL